MSQARSPLEGRALFATASLLLAAMCAAILLAVPDTVEAVRLLIRATARSSLILFLLAFTASAAYALFGGPLAGWQLRNRRQIGLAFAVSHALHLAGILVFARIAPQLFWDGRTPASNIPATITYLLIAAMAATSFDRTARAIGPRAWKWLHGIGVWMIWLTFMAANLQRVPGMPGYAVPVILLVLAAGLRLMKRVRKRRPMAAS